MVTIKLVQFIDVTHVKYNVLQIKYNVLQAFKSITVWQYTIHIYRKPF